VIQYHCAPFAANCWQLEDLRAELEQRQAA
jgi:hypothetical protein